MSDSDMADVQYIITKKEAAAMARLSERTLDRLLEDGRGPRRISLSTRRVGFYRQDLIDWIASRAAPAKAGLANPGGLRTAPGGRPPPQF